MKTNLKRLDPPKGLLWYVYIAMFAIMLGFQTSYIFKYRAMIKKQSFIMLDMEKELKTKQR
jgi:hypothetical protein